MLWELIALLAFGGAVALSLGTTEPPTQNKGLYVPPPGAFVPPSIASVDPTIAIPSRFVEFADDYFSKGPSVQRKKSIWVDKFESVISGQFSLLSWNILAQSLYEKSTLRVQQSPLSWDQRSKWILRTLSNSNADIICLQEVEDLETFSNDLLPSLKQCGYQGVIQGGPNVREIKRRSSKGDRAHFVATFWKTNKFEEAEIVLAANKKDQLVAHMARGRTLTSILRAKESREPLLAVVNCHLEGHPNQYAARIRQLQHAMDDITKRVEEKSALNGLLLAGDFNCELSSSACSTYLRIGRVGRKGGLGGVYGSAAQAIPPAVLESDEAAEVLSPILEWGQAIPNQDMESVKPHPFRRNSLVSAYPPKLDSNIHFTYCARPFRPVSGLDQIWYSSLSLTQVALRRAVSSPTARQIILQTGVPSELLQQPSDHLPIGALLEWNVCDPYKECSLEEIDQSNSTCTDLGVRELIVVPDQPPPPPKPKSPIMAYAELDILISTCPYDSDSQRCVLEMVLDEPLPPTDHKPTDEEIQKLRELSKAKKDLLVEASETARPVLQRILKLKKEVNKYEENMGFG